MALFNVAVFSLCWICHFIASLQLLDNKSPSVPAASSPCRLVKLNMQLLVLNWPKRRCLLRPAPAAVPVKGKLCNLQLLHAHTFQTWYSGFPRWKISKCCKFKRCLEIRSLKVECKPARRLVLSLNSCPVPWIPLPAVDLLIAAVVIPEASQSLTLILNL